jgi:hypothetical protein
VIGQALAAAAPVPVRLADRREVRISPLTEGDWSAILAAAERTFRDLAAAATAGAPQEVAAAVAANATPTRAVAAAYLDTPDGIVRTFWLALRREHPTITQAETAALLAANETALAEALRQATGTDRDHRADDDTPNAAGPMQLDRAELYGYFARQYGWTPQQVAAMTAQQIAAALGVSGRTIRAATLEDALKIQRELRNRNLQHPRP